MKTRILLADDHRILRKGLEALLESEDDFEIVAEAANGREAVTLARAERPDIVIMDVGMPGLNGFEATRQLLTENQNVKVLALSMHTESRYVREMFGVGALGYVLKDAAYEELIEAIRALIAGKTYLGTGISDMVVSDYSRMLADRLSEPTDLTAREREVLQLIAEGTRTRDIAATLCVSVKTVETHRKRIMDKLDLHSVAELTKYAIRVGLITL